MAAQLPLHAGPNPTLDEAWRGLATRLSPRAAALCAGLGLALVAGSRWAGLAWIVTLSGVIVSAFGCDALLRSTAGDDQQLLRGRRRVASASVRVVASVSAAAIGLVLLGMIFGDKIEVMRR